MPTLSPCADNMSMNIFIASLPTLFESLVFMELLTSMTSTASIREPGCPPCAAGAAP
ncbi:hypothetical protein D3C78_1966780 [compost metagenome]